MTPYTVIGGYLGAGKTTLLNHLLAANAGRRVALLINDFGEINVDAALVESQTQTQINLTNGCVCCTLSDDFGTALDRVLELDPSPDHVVVEASGVANVHNLAQYGHGHGLSLDGVIVVADAETVVQRAEDKYVARTVRRQLDAADLILLNKCDLVDVGKKQLVLDWLEAGYPGVPVVESVGAKVPTELLVSLDVKEHATDDRAHDHYATHAIRLANPVPRADLAAFIGAIGDDVLRAKGFAELREGGTVLVQLVGRRREIVPSKAGAPGISIVLIGASDRLDRARLDQLARSHLAGD